MNKKLQVMKLKKLVGSKTDLFDFTAEVDGRLNFEENKKNILNKLQRRGFKVKSKLEKKVRSSRLVEKAMKDNSKRSKRSKSIDGSRNAKKTFEARDLTKKQYLKWKKNKFRYDIEGVDSSGTHFKKKNITKTEARKLIKTLDFDDDLF